MRVAIDYRIRAAMAVALAFTVMECVAKPTYHCTTDDACVASDGTKGICDKNGICDFSGGGGGSSGGGSSTGGGGATGGSSGGGSTGGGGDPGTCNNDTTQNCYSCTPTNSEQLANACTSATCVPFDDATRLTKLTADGGLPPLPTAN